MIHHISIAVGNPLHVAQVLAELWRGAVAPFPGHKDGFVVLPFDTHGTLIELLPKGTELVPGTENELSKFEHNPNSSAYTATHAAISVPVSEDEIRAIAIREGWQMVRSDRQGYFEVIELWIENQLLIELLPPAIAPQYFSFMHPQSLKSFLANTVMASPEEITQVG
jgi:hypothetical protein